MLKQVMGKKIVDLEASEFSQLVSLYPQVVIDLGTGDGKFAYQYAKEHPDTLVVGIDAAAGQMADISHKAGRKAAKGGLENVIFIAAAAETLPVELTGLADQVFINFPWGSLLSGIVKAEASILSGIANLLKPGAEAHIYLSYDPRFEPQLLEQASLPVLSKRYLTKVLAPIWPGFGLQVVDVQKLNAEPTNFVGSWPKRILSSREREVYVLRVLKKGGARKLLLSALIRRSRHENNITSLKSVNNYGKKGLLPYVFHCSGHINIRATHPKTLEFSKSAQLTERGDCIVGVNADFDFNELKKFTGKIKISCQVTDPGSGQPLISEFKCKVNPEYASKQEMVLRKSGFGSDRTFGIGLNKGSNHLDRRIVQLLQTPQTQLRVQITQL